MNKLIEQYKKQGGTKLLLQLFRAHVLSYTIIQVLLQGFSKKSLEIVRLSVNNRKLCRLRKKNQKFINTYKEKIDHYILDNSKSNKVWICWLQGMDNAPNLVRQCNLSVKKNISDREVILVTQDNYKNYITFPEHIQKKIENGIITKTHMSDLLRLALLIEYGGTWIDATVYISGKVPNYMLDSNLFLFQNLKPGLDGHCTSISSWFMTSCKNNHILMLCQSLLYHYWKNHNYLVDYFLLHDFFQLALEAYNDEWNSVIPFDNSIPHILLLRLFSKYDENTWNEIKNMTCVHKLSYKNSQEERELKDTYFSEIFGENEGDKL